jgi:uncharacterized membrane protein
MDAMEALIRWAHVIAGITWIGLLYFFNWVNSAFAPTMDAETKKKVVPELLPRALYWFRWGAMWTFVSGFLLLLMVFYHSGHVFGGDPEWSILVALSLVITFGGVLVYDVMARAIKDNRVMAGLGIFLTAVAVIVFQAAGFGYRGYVIHVGAMYGTIMAFNVWMRIWPAQRIIITAIRDGETPPADKVALAGGRSKHNTYLSVPHIWMMLNQHTTFASGNVTMLLVMVALGWGIAFLCYKKAAAVKGF